MSQNDFHPDWICTCGDLTTLGVVHRKDVPCYYPDKREWVGLTDDDYEELLKARDWGVYLIEAVEAKLKEKNT